MGSKITLTPISNIETAVTVVNQNFTDLADYFDSALTTDAKKPNAMNGPLDMNSNHILNLPPPTFQTDPIRLEDFAGLLSEFGDGGNPPPPPPPPVIPPLVAWKQVLNNHPEFYTDNTNPSGTEIFPNSSKPPQGYDILVDPTTKIQYMVIKLQTLLNTAKPVQPNQKGRICLAPYLNTAGKAPITAFMPADIQIGHQGVGGYCDSTGVFHIGTSGWQYSLSTLASTISSTSSLGNITVDTTLGLVPNEPTEFTIDTEQVLGAMVNSTTITLTTRAINGSTAATHAIGAQITPVKQPGQTKNISVITFTANNLSSAGQSNVQTFHLLHNNKPTSNLTQYQFTTGILSRDGKWLYGAADKVGNSGGDGIYQIFRWSWPALQAAAAAQGNPQFVDGTSIPPVFMFRVTPPTDSDGYALQDMCDPGDGKIYFGFGQKRNLGNKWVQVYSAASGLKVDETHVDGNLALYSRDLEMHNPTIGRNGSMELEGVAINSSGNRVILEDEGWGTENPTQVYCDGANFTGSVAIVGGISILTVSGADSCNINSNGLDTLYGVGVPAGTKILSQITATTTGGQTFPNPSGTGNYSVALNTFNNPGGNGTYQVSGTPFTLSSVSMYSGTNSYMWKGAAAQIGESLGSDDWPQTSLPPVAAFNATAQYGATSSTTTWQNIGVWEIMPWDGSPLAANEYTVNAQIASPLSDAFMSIGSSTPAIIDMNLNQQFNINGYNAYQAGGVRHAWLQLNSSQLALFDGSLGAQNDVHPALLVTTRNGITGGNDSFSIFASDFTSNNGSVIHLYTQNDAFTPLGMRFDTGGNPSVYIDTLGDIQGSRALILGVPSFPASALSVPPQTKPGWIAMPLSTAVTNAPGADWMTLAVRNGSNPGTLQLVAYAGTSTTPVVIVDNVGTGN